MQGGALVTILQVPLGQPSLAVLGPLQALLEALDPVGILTGASGAESCTGALCGALPPLLAHPTGTGTP